MYRDHISTAAFPSNVLYMLRWTWKRTMTWREWHGGWELGGYKSREVWDWTEHGVVGVISAMCFMYEVDEPVSACFLLELRSL